LVRQSAGFGKDVKGDHRHARAMASTGGLTSEVKLLETIMADQR